MPGASRPESYKRTKVGVIPEEWHDGTVSGLFRVVTGTTPSTSSPEYWEDGTQVWITPADLSNNNGRVYISNCERKITDLAVRDCNLSCLPIGSIIVSTRAPVGYVALNRTEAYINQGCKGLIPKENAGTEVYYYYYLKSKTSELTRMSGGSTFKELSKKSLEQFPIPIPQDYECRQIGNILSTVDAAIAATDEVITKTEDLKRGLMQDLLTKGIDEAGRVRSEETHAFCEKQGMRVPVEWRVGKFSRVCKKALNGGTPSTKIPEYWEGTIPWITGADVVDQRIGEVRKYITAEAVENSATHVIPKGMLLLVTRTGVGKVAIAPFDIAISQDLTGIITTDDASVEYLFWTFNRANGHFLNMNQGTSINGIKRKDLMNFALPLPPLPEQHRIATILSTVDRDLAAERDHRARLQTLKKGLMQDLLTGRKRVPLDGGEAHGA